MKVNRILANLNLSENKIGDAGLAALADACAKGALAQVTILNLGLNQIGDAGLSALADACAKGALAKVTKLSLERNKIGAAGVTALASACAKGALAQVTTLDVSCNEIGDAGLAALDADTILAEAARCRKSVCQSQCMSGGHDMKGSTVGCGVLERSQLCLRQHSRHRLAALIANKVASDAAGAGKVHVTGC